MIDATTEKKDIPNRFDHASSCDAIYARWEQNGCFNADVCTDKHPFAVVIPPPNVTGALHLGHGLNNTLQDIVVRMRRMQGYQALWMPGTDHAGIATQAVVERRLKEQENKTRHVLGREKLVERIWAWKDQYETRILGQLKRMGCSCDWRRTRFTLDDTCASAVRATFFDLFSKDLIYRGKRLVNWDTFLQTAVSDDEVKNAPTKGHFWHFHYPVIDPKPNEPSTVEIATTRPETMLGDTAVAVHPDPASALDKVESDLVRRRDAAIDKERGPLDQQIDAIRQRRCEMLPKLEQLRDMARDGRMLRLPLMDRSIPLIVDPWAKPEMGSGCVKITPAHDPNDYEVGLRCELPMISILNPDGTLNAEAGSYQGMTIPEARKAVVKDMKQQEYLGDVEDREIELPYSDRSKTPIEPFLADQWFVRMDSLAQSAMDAVSDERVKIFPHRYRRGYLDWLSEKRDWPVSRQLWWGHRIPIWSAVDLTATQSETLQEQLRELANVAEGRLRFSIDPDMNVFACIREEDETLQAKVEALGMERDPDVLDTWFSSALWPHSTLGWPKPSADLDYFYPTAALMTSRDIISLWVARMVLMGLNNMGEVPFREVFIHPKILDGLGETMSKSKGNGVDPLDVIEKFGPDALRFGLTRIATETQDVRIPVQFECPHCEKLIDQNKKNRTLPVVECPACKQDFATQWAETKQDQMLRRAAVVSERFETARNFVNKLWNASRFTVMHLEDFSPQPSDFRQLNIEDRWLLSRLATVTERVTDALESYKYAEAARVLYDFAWDEFCSFYIEMAKPRLSDPNQRAATQNVLAHALDQLLRLLHPMIPFVTEEVWSHLNNAAPIRGLEKPSAANELLIHACWPVANLDHRDQRVERQFARFQAILSAIREVRSRQNIPPKETLFVALRCDQETQSLLQPMESYFSALANATVNDWGADVVAFETGVEFALPAFEIDVFLDLERFIDIPAELARLKKLQERSAKQIASKQQKLANESFISRAPADIVQQERDSLADLRQQFTENQQKIDNLNAKTS